MFIDGPIVVVAPHPDDESLGCGGTLVRSRSENPSNEIHWLIVTDVKENYGYSTDKINQRAEEIEAVRCRLSPVTIHNLGMQPSHLDTMPLQKIISAIADVLIQSKADTVLAPWGHDVHTDHQIVYRALVACSKRFRYPHIRNILLYETISETDFNLDPGCRSFRPNFWVDISKYLEQKIELVSCYQSEMGKFPFPRSVENIVALSRHRGSQVNLEAAEGFVLLRGMI